MTPTRRSAAAKVRSVVFQARTIGRDALPDYLRRLWWTRAARQRRIPRASDHLNITVVFVCYGNIMRSALAQSYFEHLRSGHPAVRVLGAGTRATRGRGAQATAITAADALGVSLADHHACPLADVVDDGATWYVCLDRMVEATACAARPGTRDRVFLIGDPDPRLPLEVFDPYGKGDAYTLDRFVEVQRACDAWWSLLQLLHAHHRHS